MALPTEKTNRVSELEKQNILIYGRAKIGKSTLCNQFPSPLFLDTENGLHHLDAFRVDCSTWEKFLTACADISKSNHNFKTIIIDTIDNMVLYASDFICRENGVNYVGDLPHGRGWALVTAEINRVISKLICMPYGLIMVSHSVQEEIETKTKKFTRETISVTGKVRNIFLNLSDIVLFIDSDIDKNGIEQRVIRTKPSIYYEAGDRSQKLPETLPLDFKVLSSYFATNTKGE